MQGLVVPQVAEFGRKSLHSLINLRLRANSFLEIFATIAEAISQGA
jgi:hypothetical protein